MWTICPPLYPLADHRRTSGIRELEVRNAIYAQHLGPDNELFTSGMKNIILPSSPISGVDPETHD